jgi:tetratricopeptide (TPR) repeat protein
MGDAFANQPEFFEVDIGESLLSRTDTLGSFRELGPPDLVHTIKSTGRTGAKEIGSYHYVSGVDASSSAALAAYINSLTYELEQPNNWFSGKTTYKLKSGAYCCFNAFSRVDVRVEVRIPGSVDAFVIDARGERHETTPEIWQEVYLSSLLRAILYSDDVNYRLAGYRKLDPISSPDAEHRFLQAAENLFFKGWQLGSDPEIQVATVVHNHLTAGILKYFGEANRYELAVNLFEKLYSREPEVAALVAQAYLGLNEEIKAVQIMHNAIKETPHSYSLLHVQCDFLRTKGKYEWAAKLAQEGVNCAPTEFSTWAKLTECYVELERWQEALFTLNSCPMFTYNERDLHRMPPPSRSHFPVKSYISDSGLLDEEGMRDTEADAALVRLPAPALRGTFSKAYALLTRLVAKIGWDELLRARSQVFVMEEEYRAQKQPPRSGEQSPVPQHKNASTQALAPTDELLDGPGGESQHVNEGLVEQTTEKSDVLGVSEANGIESLAQAIPTIKISSESDREQENIRLEGFTKAVDGKDASNDTQKVLDKDSEESSSKVEVEAPPLEKPAVAQAQAGHEQLDSAAAATSNGAHDSAGQGRAAHDGHHEQDDTTVGSLNSTFAFNNKRLCERWLDNLFMVLYEDLRVYTIWRAEVNHYKAQSLPYHKTSTEWEILGELALRLHHREEAKDAFQRCIDGKFSAKAYLRLLDIYTEEREVERSLWVALRLTAYNHRWYSEGTYPGAVAQGLYRLISEVGLAKVNFTLVSMNPPDHILRIMKNYFAYCQAFKVPGWDF